MAPARIAKYPPIQGAGLDSHMVLPPSVPPPPPAPPNPAPIPAHYWAVQIVNPAAGFALTGKWSWHRVTTEGIGNIIAGHDWGMGQPHIPLPPIVVTPSIAIRLLGSSTKYFLPSTPNKDPQDGSAPGGPGSVAVSTPAWCVCTQDCQDISGWPFFLPTSVCFQLVSTREVGFTMGDLVNGLIGMAFDSAASLICRGIAGPGGPPPETFRAALAAAIPGAAINAFVDQVTGFLPPDAQGPAKIMVATAFAIGLGKGGSDVAQAAVGPTCGLGASGVGGAAQSAIDGTRPGTDNIGHGGTPLFE